MLFIKKPLIYAGMLKVILEAIQDVGDSLL